MSPEPQPQLSVSNAALFSKNRWWRYGPLFLWMTLIFVGSTGLLASNNTNGFVHTLLHALSPHLSEERVQFWHYVIRKLGHLTEYGILALLAARAFHTSSQRALSIHYLLASFLLVAAYALLDEYHQSFIPTRVASPYDSLIDMTGGAIALSFLYFRRHTHEKEKLR